MIVVTGGTGFVGAHLLFDLCQNHSHIRAIKRQNSDLEQVKKTFSYYSEDFELLFQKIEWVDADVSDYDSLEKAFKGASKIYHSAAMVSFQEKDRQKMMEINVQGTANVVNAALYCKAKKLCHVSSVASLGRAETDQLCTEETPWKDSDKSSPYSISKYKAELEVWRGIEEGLASVIVNPSIILGPMKWDTGSAALFSLVWKGLKFYPEGESGFVYVRDVSRAMIELMESDISRQRFTLNAENVDYQKLFSLMAKNLGKPKPTIAVKPWMSELSWRLLKIRSIFTGKAAAFTKDTARSSMKKNLFSNQKIKKAIGFEFTTLEEMIDLTAKQFLNEHY
ncbi:MAG: NAD-dependent epimerase/dehydratase family protein [Bacteroidales bacterium]|jgi:dihydroflavonol-4-reductase|nr:NAD-dependent epimerase/dehydratase family protein [Bacteroidales bacterium]